MMTYEYKCEHCNQSMNVSKPISECDKKEYCAECNNELKRVYTVLAITTADGFKHS